MRVGQCKTPNIDRQLVRYMIGGITGRYVRKEGSKVNFTFFLSYHSVDKMLLACLPASKQSRLLRFR